jgi:hypothetical protein
VSEKTERCSIQDDDKMKDQSNAQPCPEANTHRLALFLTLTLYFAGTNFKNCYRSLQLHRLKARVIASRQKKTLFVRYETYIQYIYRKGGVIEGTDNGGEG